MIVAQLDRLKAQLLTSGLSQKNQPLFQVINQLIDAVRQGFTETDNAISGGSGGGGGGGLANLHYLTHQNDFASLPFSRELLAGTGISFDDSIISQRTVNVTVVSPEWSVLTNGDLILPELVFAGGDVIMTHTP